MTCRSRPNVASRSSEPSGSTRPAVPLSSGTPLRREASASSTPAISSISASRPRPMPRPGCNAMARAVLRKASGGPPIVPGSIATVLLSRRPVVTRPGSRPCTGSTSRRCTATRFTSSATITPPRTPRSGRSSARSPPCRGSRSAPVPTTPPTHRRSGSGCSASPATPSRTSAAPPDGPSTRWRPRSRRASRSSTRTTSRRTRSTRRCRGSDPGRASACRPTGAGRSSCASSTSCRTAEIAGILGRSEGAVRVLLHRALRSVARDLGREPRTIARSDLVTAGGPSDRMRAPVEALELDGPYLDRLLAAGDAARRGRSRGRGARSRRCSAP